LVAYTNDRDVLARYGNWYHGEDDEFAHCLILRDGASVRLFEGSQDVRVEIDRSEEAKHERLADLLAAGIPAGWPAASYTGYNFIPAAEGADATEIAVYGVQAGDNRSPGQYYAAEPTSEIGQLVKELAKID
jgi:hypothetical protein